MFLYIFTFISVFVINVSYTYYLKAVQNEKIYTAGAWSAAINLVASLAIIGYIENHWLLIPSCLGSFFGTIAGMKVSK